MPDSQQDPVRDCVEPVARGTEPAAHRAEPAATAPPVAEPAPVAVAEPAPVAGAAPVPVAEPAAVAGAAPVAEVVARAWSEALGLAGVDGDRRLFESGATSAAALRAHSALCAGLGREVPLTALFTRPTVRDLAVFLAVYAAQAERDEGAEAPGNPPRTTLGRKPPVR
ncbi:phosphopantetheine-binding protein [Streptomyces sp. NPDC001941]|uniref:acyl carrier protein n=1 Tax=Streptomyces sp. NPDC001941 TaxID=3154659 RepID=UPI00332B6311